MKAQVKSPNLKNLDTLARWMDTKFSIPGTKIRFGLDAIIGLVPGIGDLITFGISFFLWNEAKKKGASGFVMARMMLNTGIDLVFGAIPVLGDIFDVMYKSNQRNMKLLREHFEEGRHQGSAAKIIIPVVILLLAVFAGLIWLCYKIIVWLF